ncbi:MAG: hypothetical protein K1X88_16160 [Nannocystaceae bacterium]|nr:hypothetical protein [Nannocystaceae bacterium]
MACSNLRAPLGWSVAVGVLWAQGLALRLSAAPWWAAVGGDGGAAAVVGAAVLELASLVAMAMALGAAVSAQRTGWPWTAMLIVSAAGMHAVWPWLLFGSHDVGLALAWASVQALVLGAAALVGLRWSPRVAALLAIPIARLVLVAVAMPI